ncbi:MAG: YidC/Oxa1 family membrane protein insertase, partial [Ignavibacteriales bacterium]
MNPWHFLVSKLSELIQYCYHLTDLAGLANYGLAIILVSIIIKALLFPLNNASMKSMRGMQEIQPKMKEIQERYKENPEKMQAETMKMYKEHGVNPFGGCLPLLIQMPILFAFYQALVHFQYTEKAHAVFLWITAATTLSKPDPTYLLPVLAGVTTFIQQKLSTM